MDILAYPASRLLCLDSGLKTHSDKVFSKCTKCLKDAKGQNGLLRVMMFQDQDYWLLGIWPLENQHHLLAGLSLLIIGY